MQGFTAGKRTLIQGIFALFVLTLWAIWSTRYRGDATFMPPPWEVGVAIVRYLGSGELLYKARITLTAIGAGLLLSIALAAVMSLLALYSSRTGYALEALVTLLHPMPSVAVIPLVILWIGIGFQGIVVLTLNSCLWPLLLNTMTGFRAVHQTYMEVGRNIGMRQIHMIVAVMIPSALPYILTGLKTAWARSWRTAVAAEMVFGATTGAEGLGWFIFEALQFVDFSRILAGLFIIIIIGLAVERLAFETVERWTIIRWGMAR
ncbi:MAG: ABC transporter permease [Candidatus Methylomirabilales bacterium]